MMDYELQQLLRELGNRGQQNDAAAQTRRDKLLNLEPDTAHLISLLVRSSGCRSILEIGTSNGYSTIWLAWAARFTSGHVTSIERDPAKQAMADANLRRAGLRDSITLLSGEGTELVRSLPGPFDCVFFDADRTSAPDQLALLLPKLSPGVLLLADNVLSHPDEIAPYLAAVAALPGFDHMVVPVGKGLSLAYRGDTAG